MQPASTEGNFVQKTTTCSNIVIYILLNNHISHGYFLQQQTAVSIVVQIPRGNLSIHEDTRSWLERVEISLGE